MSISILVLTLNEEQNIAACLESVAWSDDIIVLDSGSTDKTVEIAETYGARIVHRRLDDWSTHQNWALENIEYKNPWVYYSDADEVVTPELRDEMLRAVADPESGCAAYRMRYKNYFMGRWIRHCGIYPTWIMRLFRPEKVRWERKVNPVAVIDGNEGRLQGHFEHYSFNKGFNAWFEKHNSYSWNEALEAVKHTGEESVDWGGVLSVNNPVRLRRALKELSFRLPLRAVIRFVYMYFVRLGILDGMPGLTYCILLSIYEYMIVLKMKEIKRREKNLSL